MSKIRTNDKPKMNDEKLQRVTAALATALVPEIERIIDEKLGNTPADDMSTNGSNGRKMPPAMPANDSRFDTLPE